MIEALSVDTIRSAKGGNEQAVKSVIKRCFESIAFRMMLKRSSGCYTVEDADDLESEAKLKLLKNLNEYDLGHGVSFEIYFLTNFKHLLGCKAKRNKIELMLFSFYEAWEQSDWVDTEELDSFSRDCVATGILEKIDIRRVIDDMPERRQMIAEMVMADCDRVEITRSVCVSLPTIKADLRRLGNSLIVRGIVNQRVVEK